MIPVELSIIFTLRSWPAKGMGKRNFAPSYLEEVWPLLKARRVKFSLIFASLLLDFHILALWGGGRFALIKTKKEYTIPKVPATRAGTGESLFTFGPEGPARQERKQKKQMKAPKN